MRISDWSSDVCSSDLIIAFAPGQGELLFMIDVGAQGLLIAVTEPDDAGIFFMLGEAEAVLAIAAGLDNMTHGCRDRKAPLAVHRGKCGTGIDRKSTRLNSSH